jgi:hypothetical protein
MGDMMHDEMKPCLCVGWLWIKDSKLIDVDVFQL